MSDQPLTAREEALWRAFARLMVSLPRELDDDLLRATGLSLTDYSVLMHLSEAENHQLRMADLATATALSASRITRVVDALRARGLTEKRRTDSDGRGNNAVLTPAGLERLKAAYPTHLASVRRLMVDVLDPEAVDMVGGQLAAVVDRLYPGCRREL